MFKYYRHKDRMNQFYLLTVCRIQSLNQMLLYQFYMDETIDWDKVIKKEARGLDDYDLGEVQEIDQERVITKEKSI